MDQQRIRYLFGRYTAGTATPEEIADFQLLVQQDEHEAHFKAIIDELLHTATDEVSMPEERITAMVGHILHPPVQPVLRSFARRWWWAAAAVPLLIGGSLYFLQRGKTPAARIPLADKAAGHNMAVLTLENGDTILLDSKNNRVIQTSNGSIVQQGGQLQHIAMQDDEPPVQQTLRTPAGGEYKVILPDSSIVWLNAASSLQYPSRFTGSNRTVLLTGEAYFEISKDASRPFLVKTALQDVLVLGTSFNINAYDNESKTITTLQDGAIKVCVSSEERGTVLKPGEQAVSSKQSPVPMVSAAVPGDAIAWKNGLLLFDNTDIPAVMRILERWYDVTVIYEGAIPTAHFTGQISRSTSLAHVLHMLTQISDVHFRLSQTDKQGTKDIIQVLNNNR